MTPRLAQLTERWSTARAAERANFQSYLIELCDALELPRPQPAGSGYEFELPLQMVTADGTTTTKFADLVKDGCFLLEAKDVDAGRSTDLLLRRAFGQATQYSAFVPNGHPPYLLVLDVGATLYVWDRWSGTYGGFQAGRRIDLKTLHERPDDIALIRDIFTNPAARDPRERANAVTREIAGKLAELAAGLESKGYENERVARFLMRCVFTMFSEDVDLLPDEPFKGAVQLGLDDADEFSSAVSELWTAMDEGRRFGLKKLLRFNGRFFQDKEVLPLTRREMVVLAEAARADWSNVEPTIFGTLLVRALDPVERHRLGAEYTPREYVERLIRPTIEEPVREQWTLVQAEVLQLRERGRPIDNRRAIDRLRQFHAWLRGLKVLDPACGSGNFLYVSLATLKSIELEVMREMEAITGMPELPVEEVDPAQFYGIEVKPWARELAELTLWVGYYQWWRRTHGHTLPPEPVLRDTGTLECRDAVLAWDRIVHRPEKDRPDPTPRIEDPVTGRLVPDPDATLPYYEYVGARQAPWPEADFIVGNPPYIGTKRMRDTLGDGYVDALRSTYPEIPESADYVMYWWSRAASTVATGATKRSGLITTNTIVQSQNRQVVAQAAEQGTHVIWAVRDHPWVDDVSSAAVRVSMTVTANDAAAAVLVAVDEQGDIVRQRNAARLNVDLTVHADVPSAAGVPLRANKGLSAFGFALHGRGFLLEAVEATRVLDGNPDLSVIVRPYVSGRDLLKKTRDLYVIDFALMDEAEARQFSLPYDIVRSRVKPHRDTNARASIREGWWRFGWPRPELRQALEGLDRFVVTTETSRHRIFSFLDGKVAPDHGIVCIASEDALHLGVLASEIHQAWALAAGSRLGVGNDPRYNKTKCFDPFPFPDATEEHESRIREIAERLDAHRTAALADEDVTMTGMYNVVAKLRSGERLSAKEREIHTRAACGVLKDLHDELDAAVALAYGWPWPLEKEEILERLVFLHDQRVQEEQAGFVRWLRPDYQVPRFGTETDVLTLTLAGDPHVGDEDAPVVAAPRPWPDDVLAQLAAVRELVATAPAAPAQLAARFNGAKRSDVMAHLEALEVLGVIHRAEDGRYHHTGVAAAV